MIVVDASVAVSALLNDGRARQMLSENRLAAPHLVDAEVIQTLRKLLGRGSMAAEAAEQAVQRWSELGIERFPLPGLIARIWAHAGQCVRLRRCLRRPRRSPGLPPAHRRCPTSRRPRPQLPHHRSSQLNSLG